MLIAVAIILTVVGCKKRSAVAKRRELRSIPALSHGSIELKGRDSITDRQADEFN